MSGFFNALVNADDSCGPVNPLAQLSKGLQGEGSQIGRDRFVALPGASASGSSSFRSHALQPAEVGHDAAAAAFFHGQGHPSHSHLDLNSLRNALPQHHGQAHSHAPSPVPMPAWAADFMQNKSASPAPLSERAWQKSRHLEGRAGTPAWAHDFAAQTPSLEHANARRDVQSPGHGHQQLIAPLPQQQYGPQLPWQASQQPAFHMGQFQHHQPMLDMHATHQIAAPMQQDPVEHITQWEDAFMQHALKQSPKGTVTDLHTTQMEELHESLTARPVSPSQLANQNDPDALAKTAGDLLQNMSGDLANNTKMRDSSFMALMRKLRDREIVVEGDKMVEAVASTSTSTAQTFETPPGFGVHSGQMATANATQTIESLTDAYEEMNAVMDQDPPMQTVDPGRAFQGDGGRMMDDEEDEQGYHWQPVQGRVPGATSAWEEDFDFDNTLLRSGPLPPTMAQSLRTNAQQQEWGDLQSEWDRHQATATGLDALNTASYSNYPFHSRNPYLLSHSRQHLPVNTLLEKEADVQMYPENASAWLSLGLKQQENEREPLAIQALLRALELDSSLGDAWLGLAVSYTNDNLRGKAYSAIERWAELQSDYRDVVQDYASRMNALGQGSASDDSATLGQRHAYLTGLLVEMARAGASTESYVDPEVQIALGVLFNASEEYDKACDCFSAALSIRPEDPHLYNRMGATLANSGRSVDAIEYYFRALELQPDFARATFNLAIACINLGNHQEAAEHLLRSLQMQGNTDEDVGEPILQHITDSENTDASNLLWETLATCCNNLKRADLAQACSNRNLAPFRSAFAF